MSTISPFFDEDFLAVEDRDADAALCLAQQDVLNARRGIRDAFASIVVPDIG
jgi:hypothetical protein